jgi:hypothetical protein
VIRLRHLSRTRAPRAVLLCLAGWTIAWLIFLGVASVPAFTPPWRDFTSAPQFSVIEHWWPWIVATVVVGWMLLASPFTWSWQVEWVNAARDAFREHRALAWLLIASAIVRFALVMRGGQYFDWDEVRYGGSATWMFAYLSLGEIRTALDVMLRSPDHPGFRVIGLILAFFHVTSAWPTGLPITEMRYPTGEWLPAFLLSLSSVCCIGLVYALAIRSGASKHEAFLAAFLTFASCSMLMFAQHFYPYDASMAIVLFALWLGLHDRDHVIRSFSAGLFCGFGFLTYEGYWLMATVVGVMHVMRTPVTIFSTIRRSIFFAGGAMVLPVLLVVAGWATGRPFLTAVREFSHTVYHGDFSEGWLLPWEYFWNVDHALLIVYAVGLMSLIAHFSRYPGVTRGVIWLCAALAIYVGLVVGSNGLHRFVVYDRLARQMIPFICLAAAAGLARVRRGALLSGTPAVLLYMGIALIFMTNAAPLLAQRYPRDVAREVIRRSGRPNVRLVTTVGPSDEATVGVFLPFDAESPSAATMNPRRYVLLNAKDIWLLDDAYTVTAPPPGRVLFSLPHPRQLRSMQFHGYGPHERAFLRSTDLSMKLIDTGAN